MNTALKQGFTLAEGGKGTFEGFQLKLAFTMAEVLITLAIIGVIAAMTLPSLINKTNNAENVVALKKSYETLSQAFYRISSDNGSIINALSSVATHEDLANIFISKLQISKNCGTASAKASGCFMTVPNTPYKYLNGVNWSYISTDSTLSTILTNDNVSYAFHLDSPVCSTDYGSYAGIKTSPLYNICGWIYADINGPNKGPSMMGRDVFWFFITQKGIYPRGSYRDAGSDCAGSDGFGCAGKVILESAMNY